MCCEFILLFVFLFFFFKQKTAYEMRISDWSSDVCSSDLSGLPISVQQLRPDYLLSDATIQLYDITLLETSAQDGTAAFDAKLRTHAGYAQLQAEVAAGINVSAGVRYETAKQTVFPIDLFDSGASAIVPTDLDADYWLPARPA